MINATTLTIAILFLASGLSASPPTDQSKTAQTLPAAPTARYPSLIGKEPVERTTAPEAPAITPQLRAFLCQPLTMKSQIKRATECTRTDI
ncbi:MAG: hypothetical protein AAF385_16345 [Pseudomonadota bacterium]